MKIYICFLLFIFIENASSQSLEILYGNESIFIDSQWLKRFEESKKLSLFSRSTANIDEDDNVSLFNGNYLNYTSKLGIGPSLVGGISSGGLQHEIGIHYFAFKKDLLLFSILSTDLDFGNYIAWFTILRYRPDLIKEIKLYSNFEYYIRSDFNDHILSIERIRLGLDYKKFQFGLALNLSQIGNNFKSNSSNIGAFIRKEF